MDEKNKFCSIVVYGQTLVKRDGKGTNIDPLLAANINCVHPEDFATAEDGQMVEVFVSAPWVERLSVAEYERYNENEEDDEEVDETWSAVHATLFLVSDVAM